MNRRFAPSSAAWARALARAGRYAALAAVLALVLLAAIYVAARAYLPALIADTERLEARASELVRHTVRLGQVSLDWDGPFPRVRVHDVTVLGDDGALAVRIAEVRARIAPLALLRGRVEAYRLVLVRPRLTLARAADGRIGVPGMTRGGGAASPQAGVAWLLRQPRVAVRDGELHWRDAAEPDASLSLARIDIGLRNDGNRHRLSLQADFPDALCRQCSAAADIVGLPGHGEWGGEIELQAQGLELARLPQVVRERLPAAVHGRLDVRLAGEWEQGRLHAARGVIDVEGLRVRAAKRASLTLGRVAGTARWQATDAGWRLEADALRVGLAGAPWPTGGLRLERDGARSRLALGHLVLDDVARFAVAHASLHPWLAEIAARAPAGRLHDIEAELRGALVAPHGYRLHARLDDVAVAAYRRLPGLRGVSGELALDGEGGLLALAADGLVLDFPSLFRAPLEAAHASGMLHWQRTDAAWRVDGTELALQSPDASATGRLALELPHDRVRSPVLDLQVDFRDADGAQAKRYYPVHKLPPRVLAWMESAFVDGRITRGRLIYRGPIRAFPFERGEGRFALQADVRDGVYRYLPGWTPLTQVEASVAIEGVDARISGHARIGALEAREVEVTVGRAGASARSVRVHGVVEGPIAEAVRVLRAVQSTSVPAWRDELERVVRASGRGRLELRGQVALGGGRRSFQAAYGFDGATFELEPGVRIEAASGALRLDEAGLQEARLDARAYGGALRAEATRAGGGLRLQAKGSAQVAELLHDRGALARRLGGSLDWTLSWREAGDARPHLRFESDLSGVRTQLPPPLDGTGAAFPRTLTMTTVDSDAQRMTLALDGGAGVSGRLLLARANDAWRFVKGRLDIGRAPGRLPAGEGLELGIDVEEVDLDQWLPLLDSARGGDSRPGIIGVNAQIKRLILLDRDWGRVFLNLARRGAEWRAVLDGDAAAGEALLLAGADRPPTVRLDLAYLRLPSRRDAAAGDDETGPDPRRLPRLDLEVRSFEHRQRRYGELELRGDPQPQGWRIERLSLARPETALSVAGIWQRTRQGDRSRFSLELESRNLGETLDAWGVRGQMRGGQVQLQASLAWPGTPTSPRLAGLDGRVEISAENGRFLQLDPGAARLFGLLDLRAIGRYLTLDFSPALAKGLVFDAIHSDIAIARGNASTDAFILSGPSLNLHAAGRVGLPQEDYDLRLDVSPRVSDTLTLTSWGLFGPQAAAAVLAFQRLFRRQIEEGTRISYTIKGPWDSPEIRRLPKPAPASQLPDPTS